MQNYTSTSDYASDDLIVSKDSAPYKRSRSMKKAAISAAESSMERRIEEMLLRHNRYYIYCE